MLKGREGVMTGIWVSAVFMLMSDGVDVSLIVRGRTEGVGLPAAVVWRCLAGTEIISSAKVETDSDGGAELSLPADPSGCSVWAAAPGFGLGKADVGVSQPKREVRLELGPEAGIRLRAAEEMDKSPVRQGLKWRFLWQSGDEGPEVELPSELLHCEVDEFGNWTILGLPTDPLGRFSMELGGRMWATERIPGVVLDRPGVRDLGVLFLARRVSLCGQVMGLEEGEIGAVQFRSSHGTLVRRPTSPDGGFCLDGVPAGRPVKLWAVASGPRESAVTEVVPPAGSVVLTVPAARFLRGAVRDASSGQPVTAFEITLRPRDALEGGVSATFFHRSKVENEAGTFSLHLPADPVPTLLPLILVVAAPGRPEVRIDFADLPWEEEVFVEVREFRTLEGRVERVSDGVPLPGARVSVQCGPEAVKTSAVTRADGSFLLTAVSPEECALATSYPGYVTDRLAVADGDGPMDVGTIRLVPGLRLGGEVRSAGDHRPLPGVRVTATADWDRTWVTESDAKGRFVFRELPGARFHVMAEKEGFRQSGMEVDLRTDGHAEIALSMQGGVLLEGVVHGLPGGGDSAVLHFFGEAGEILETSTGHGGRFSVSGAPTGPVRFAVRHHTLRDLCVGAFVVAAGAHSWREEIDCESRGFIVDGVLMGAGGLPEGGAILSLLPKSGVGRSATAQTDGSGRFEFRDVVQGSYQVVVVVPGVQRMILWQGELLRRSSLLLSNPGSGDEPPRS